MDLLFVTIIKEVMSLSCFVCLTVIGINPKAVSWNLWEIGHWNTK